MNIGFLEKKTEPNIQDFIICIEMVFAALAYRYTFSVEDFIDATKSPRPILNNLKIVLFF